MTSSSIFKNLDDSNAKNMEDYTKDDIKELKINNEYELDLSFLK